MVSVHVTFKDNTTPYILRSCELCKVLWIAQPWLQILPHIMLTNETEVSQDGITNTWSSCQCHFWHQFSVNTWDGVLGNYPIESCLVERLWYLHTTGIFWRMNCHCFKRLCLLQDSSVATAWHNTSTVQKRSSGIF